MPQDSTLQSVMQTSTRTEKGQGRIEVRTAFITTDIDWLEQKKEFSAEQFLHHARMEWSVESMHWLLDIHFEEDWCRIASKDV